MGQLPGIAGRLNRRQFVAILVAAAGVAFMVLAVTMHSPLFPDLFAREDAGSVEAGAVTVDEPAAPEIQLAEPIDVLSDNTLAPLAGLGTTPAPTPRSNSGTTPSSAPTTTTTAPPAPPPPTTTSTTLPTVIPGIPIGGRPLVGG